MLVPRTVAARSLLVAALVACDASSRPAEPPGPSEPPVPSGPPIAIAPPAVDAPPAPAPRAPITIAFVGDVMFGRYRGGRLQPIPADRPGLLASVAPRLRAADLAIANLETPLARTLPTPGPRERRRFAATPDHAAILAAAGFDAVSLANNHADDLGDLGAVETPAVLRAAGIQPLGAARPTAPAIVVDHVTVGGWRLGVVAVTTVRNRSQRADAPLLPYVTLDALAATVGPIVTAAGADCDRVIVLVHWGVENRDTPTAAQRAAAHALIDAGAAAVIGSHPHVLQPVERYRDALIAYSLGNFVFDNLGPRVSRSGILTMRFDPATPCATAAFTPIVVRSGYRPQPATRAEARAIRATIGRDLDCAPGPTP